MSTVTDLQSETEAVAKAAREFLRMTQLRELKAVSGKVDYCDAGDELEAMELRELPPNQCDLRRSGSGGYRRMASPGSFSRSGAISIQPRNNRRPRPLPRTLDALG
jgi:hypothetical protein